ncbi:unnamed protein product [Cylicostephanus goldi]|uniref:Uncharacterized protein n=1 Tax=Cylicostephanus goldi TaxID=71465 RepID=A0A3P7MNM3_CYLGO|nr:unnamed protein product [Cylicostephanus goldi]
MLLGQWVSIGRVLTQTEMQARKRADPQYPVNFVLVCKRTIRLRIEKQYYTIEEAAARFSISTEAIMQEKHRNRDSHDTRAKAKRPADVAPNGPSAKALRR